MNFCNPSLNSDSLRNKSRECIFRSCFPTQGRQKLGKDSDELVNVICKEKRIKELLDENF